MNTKVLKEAEKKFLKKYPGGFRHPEMVAVGKRHKMDQLEALARESFAKKQFEDPKGILSRMATLVSRSTMVSMFEKPKFKAAMSELSKRDQEDIVDGLYNLLHGKQKAGFEQWLAQLKKRKLGRWTLMTTFPAYYRPNKEVFIKPTTAKLIVQKLELPLEYHSTPTWDFYRDFRKAIAEMRTKVSTDLAPNNPAFCGFLMVTLGDQI